MHSESKIQELIIKEGRNTTRLPSEEGSHMQVRMRG